MHLSPAQLGLSFGLFNYARGRRHSRRHPLPARRFFSRALELLAHRKVESVKSAGSSEFLLGTLPTEPILNAQLASLVGKGAGRRGEIAGDLSRPQETGRPGKEEG